jgi:hypothetical protein
MKKQVKDYSFDAYKNPENFITKFDVMDTDLISKESYAKNQYKKGFELGQLNGKINITESGSFTSGNSVSFEKIGVSRNTKELLKGFIDSGAEIMVARSTEKGIEKKIIQESTQNIDFEYDKIGGLQIGKANEVKSLYPDINIILLQTLKDNNVLSAQIKNTTLEEYSLSSVDSNNSYYTTKDNKYAFISSSENIYKSILEMEIKKSNSKIEESAAIIKRDNIDDIPYQTRNTLESINKDGRNYKIHIQPKQHHQDQQRVFYIEEQQVKKKLKKSSPKL